jgi:primosomal protein N' (replication factor Y)
MSDTRQEDLFQQELFRGAARWEADDAADCLYARIVFNRPMDTVYYYEVPDRLRAQAAAGKRVLAPLGRGNRLTSGYCVGLSREAPRRQLKPLARVLDEQPPLGPAMLELTRWMADHYLCSWGQVLDAVLPAGVKNRAGTRVVRLLRVDDEVKRRRKQLDLPPKQRRALEVLCDSPRPLSAQELARASGCTLAPVTALRRRGLLETVFERVERFTPEPGTPEAAPEFDLNTDQEQALARIQAALTEAAHRTFLLHGVTGSGKTEVYIRAIQEAVSYGRQAIVLVPEISLTPQTIRRFRSRFEAVAVLHSHLSDAERHWHWQRIAGGQVQVVVGARSAVFAPTPHLGLIVLDEEHESSFKQETTPRYHARDVARWRARHEGVPLILGSATPSLESWREAAEGTDELISLPQRVLDLPLPAVRVLDLRQETERRRGRHALALPLEQAMHRALADGGQVILLLNRRGFSTHIQCPRCGQAVKCRHCDIPLIHHRRRQMALCHYCDFEVTPPEACAHCEFPGLRYQGIGTERLESEVTAKFPQYRTIRMDSDTMRGTGSHDRALATFRSGETHILLGTQMIAKGLDFPNVTLVGVVNADTADFRAAERTFQLVAQVAGRTGRGPRGGRVLVQTFSPDHPAIAAASHHDFLHFAGQELAQRRRYGYPPYGRMARVIVRSTDEARAAAFAEELAAQLRGCGHGAGAAAERDATTEQSGASGQRADKHPAALRVLGPAPAPIAKLQDYFRFHLQLQAPHGSLLQQSLRDTLEQIRVPNGVEYAVDVDPLNML